MAGSKARETNSHEGKSVKLSFSNAMLPVDVRVDALDKAVRDSKEQGKPIIAVVIGTKPDFYKQAPLVLEAASRRYPLVVINTGQHFDDLLGFGIKEFSMEPFIACSLNIRGNLVEKASEIFLKFGGFGRYFKKTYGESVEILPIVHGDTLVAGIASLAWTFGIGQKVAQNEAGLRAMCPEAMRRISADKAPSRATAERFVQDQFEGKWFIAREEPFPEQIDTWICSAATGYFFAPVELNRRHLLREGYPDESIAVVGNSVTDALQIRRKERPSRSIFEIYPALESGDWLRVDIHRRENLTERRFTSIIGAVERLVDGGQKVTMVMMNATNAEVDQYGLRSRLRLLAERHPDRFVMTPLWQEWGNVLEFLDSGKCRAALTDSGSLQEELLYFPKVLSFTARFSTERPETVFTAKSNVLVPPASSAWMEEVMKSAYREGGSAATHKRQLYGKPGSVSKKILDTIDKEAEKGGLNTSPWLHTRLGLWKGKDPMSYM